MEDLNLKQYELFYIARRGSKEIKVDVDDFKYKVFDIGANIEYKKKQYEEEYERALE